MLFLYNILFIFLVFFNVIGYGFALNKILGLQKKNILNLYISGSSLILFFSLLINFFYPLNIFVTNTFFILFTSLGLINFIKNIEYKKYLNNLFLILFFTTFITYKSYPNADYEFYHLPYQEILRHFKIIFGLSNFEFSFGHSSILLNISSFQYNTLMHLDSYTYFVPILVSVILTEIYFNYFKKSHLFIKFISFIFLVNYFLHGNRYGALGNDFPAHALSLLCYILFFYIIQLKNSNLDTTFILILSLIISIFSKLTLLLNIFILLPFVFLKENLIIINKRIFIFAFILLSLILLKNFINTSCILFPIQKTCFETNWSPEKYDFSNAKVVNNYVSALAWGFNSKELGYEKDNYFFDKKNIINESIKSSDIYAKLTDPQKKIFRNNSIYEEYNKLGYKLSTFTKNPGLIKHFKDKLFNDLITFLLINILFFYFYNKNYKLNIYQNYSSIFTNKINIYFFGFISLSVIAWCIKGPLLRYGLSYVYIFISIPFLLFILKFSTSKKNINNYFKIIIILTFIYSISKNINRIINFDLKENYTKTIIPLQVVNFDELKYDNLIIRLPKKERKLGRICSFVKPLCVNQEAFLTSNFRLIKKNDYLFVKK